MRQAERFAPGHALVINEAAMGCSARARRRERSSRWSSSSKPNPLTRKCGSAWRSRCARADRTAEAVAALDRSLALNPQNVAALLEKGSLQEQLGNPRAAATTYFEALQCVPPGAQAPPPLRERLEHARQAVDANHNALEFYLEDALAPLRARYADEPLKRFDHCVELLLKKRRLYRQQPTFLYFPELPAIEFYDRDLFPWLNELEGRDR